MLLIFKHKVEEYSNKLGVTIKRIVIKHLKNRWGSMTKEGSITINLNLVKARENIERIFGSWLSDEDVQILKRLKDSQYDYLDLDRHRKVYSPQGQPQQQSSISITDELTKLANLKERGVISEDEFQQMKQDLIKRRI
jgi:hypothetical protein